MLQCLFFNVALHIFAMLQYLQLNVALHSFSICFCNVAVEVFVLFLRQGCGEGTGGRGAKETGFVLFRSMCVEGGQGFIRHRRPDTLARRTSGL
jgi:hypothetical protein